MRCTRQPLTQADAAAGERNVSHLIQELVIGKINDETIGGCAGCHPVSALVPQHGRVVDWRSRVQCGPSMVVETVPALPDVDHGGWFLNSGVGVRLVGKTFVVVGLLAGFSRFGAPVVAQIIAGAMLAMTAVLIATGPGTIFPIVLAFGAVIVSGATGLGFGVGAATRRLLDLARA